MDGFHLRSILTDAQVEAAVRAHRHHESDVERAARSREFGGEPAHGHECALCGTLIAARCTANAARSPGRPANGLKRCLLLTDA